MKDISYTNHAKKQNIYSHATKQSKVQIADALQNMLRVHDKSDTSVRNG